MIGKVCRRGSDVRRLLGYLFLEGQAGERGLASDHADAHVVAGYERPELLQPPRREDGRFDLSRLAALLTAPVLAGNVGKDARPVYHLAISSAKTDRLLTDGEWADIAAEYVHQMGLAPRGDDQAVRWVAVRHAPDHVHVVATLVRQDGHRAFPRQDFLRSRDASRTVEGRYGLTTTAPAGGISTPETSRAEWRKHQEDTARRQAQGRPAPAGPDRQVLRARVHDAATGSSSWEDFAARLLGDGVLVRPRYSTQDSAQVTGYAVALRPVGRDREQDRQVIWFGGGRLAPDLTLPRLQQRWRDAAGSTGRATADGYRSSALRFAMTRDEGTDHWTVAVHAVHAARQAVAGAAIGATTTQAQDSAAAAASSASDVFHAVSRLTEGKRGGPLRDAAELYDRASRPPRSPTPAATPVSRAVRSAARDLLASGVFTGRETRQLLQLLAALASLADAVARLREAQRHAARAEAARNAAERLLAHRARTAATESAPERLQRSVGRDRTGGLPPGWARSPSAAARTGGDVGRTAHR